MGICLQFNGCVLTFGIFFNLEQCLEDIYLGPQGAQNAIGVIKNKGARQICLAPRGPPPPLQAEALPPGGGVPPIPQAYVFRNRKEHGVLDYVLQHTWTKAERRQGAEHGGEAEAEAAEGHVPLAKRANRVLDFFLKRDPVCKVLTESLILASPLQHVLNAAFKADKATDEHAANLRAAAESEDKRREAFALNASFLLGSRGDGAVRAYSERLLSDHQDWRVLEQAGVSRYDGSRKILRALAPSWRRLWFTAQEPRRQMFSVCIGADGGEAAWNPARMETKVAELKEKQKSCAGCLRDGVSEELLSEAERAPRLIWETMCSFLAFMRVSSLIVEKAHLPAQETMPPKARGRALHPSSMGEVTYRRTLVAEHTTKKAGVLKDVLPRRGFTPKQWADTLRRAGGFSTSCVTRRGSSRASTKRVLHVVMTSKRKKLLFAGFAPGTGPCALRLGPWHSRRKSNASLALGALLPVRRKPCLNKRYGTSTSRCKRREKAAMRVMFGGAAWTARRGRS